MKYALAAATLALTLGIQPAFAGVVITQSQSITGGMGNRTSNQTLMVQGNKQKMVTDSREIITDLDAGKLYVVQPSQKSYMSVPFPPQGPMGQMLARNAGLLDFKKVGTTRTIAGYPCTDYSGSADAMGGSYTITECFSTAAPGAKDFSHFLNALAGKLKTAGLPTPKSGIPAGLPLAADSTIKMGSFTPPAGMSKDQADKIRAMIAKRPPIVSKTVVSSVAVKDLPADTFTIPTGFTERKPPAPMPMRPAGAGAPAGAGSPGAAPLPLQSPPKQ